MNKIWEKVEHYNARLIPYAIVVLLFVIIIELGFHNFAEHYHNLIVVLDTFVIAVFVIDLIFLAIRAKSTVYFFKHYWLDIVAIFPFAIAMAGLSKLIRIFTVSGKVSVGQAIVHESLEARKGVRALSRAGKITRWLRIVARLIRVITKSRLFSHFQVRHHLAKRNMKAGKNTRKIKKTNHKIKKKINKKSQRKTSNKIKKK